ncbi:hypothetical protein [Arthrobacter bambusae]|uniref:hypothetical protein n=1 Tax=Arthrobacter bambusae TaxID=1338426 RepID=UPI002786395B|nr:hypothetical protein [Arthrobacter bambusae]MDQ0212123.1 hypothetical protein [Arthrobacter bambusae]MDQ0236659.1 hypothetical protein [Arthrobacter bambusae]
MTATKPSTTGRDFSLAEFFIGLAFAAQLAAAMLGIANLAGLAPAPAVILTAADMTAGVVAFVRFLGRK